MGNDSRERMVASAAALMSSCGLTATSFADVLAHSGAPRGSIYHHFPRGKQQLAEDAINWTSERILAHLRSSPATSAAEVLGSFITIFRQAVVTSQGSSGCAVASIALDTVVGDGEIIEVIR